MSNENIDTPKGADAGVDSTDLLGRSLEPIEAGRLLHTGEMLRSVHGQYFEVLACSRNGVAFMGPTGDEEHWSWNDVERRLFEPSFA